MKTLQSSSCKKPGPRPGVVEIRCNPHVSKGTECADCLTEFFDSIKNHNQVNASNLFEEFCIFGGWLDRLKDNAKQEGKDKLANEVQDIYRYLGGLAQDLRCNAMIMDEELNALIVRLRKLMEETSAQE